MTTYEVKIRVELDDEALEAHDGDAKPPINNINDWYGGDLQHALEQGIVEIEHEPITMERAV